MYMNKLRANETYKFYGILKDKWILFTGQKTRLCPNFFLKWRQMEFAIPIDIG